MEQQTMQTIAQKYVDDQGLWTVTYGKLLEEVAKVQPNHMAVKYTDRDYARTYKEFNEECDTIAKAFLAMGIKKGDHIAIWATNIPQWLLTLFAASKVGAVLVTVNTAYKVFELEYLLQQSDAKILVMDKMYKGNNYVEIINELCPGLKNSAPGELNNPMLPFLKSIVYCGDETVPGTYAFDELYEMAKDVDDAAYRAIYESIDCHDVFNMQYTSGTTGFPKGVMLTHYNVVNNGKSIGDCMKFSPDDALCITVPLFHCFGLVLGVTACLTHGTTMIPVDVYEPLKVMKALQSEKCTALHGVPTMFIAILEHPDFDQYDFSTLRTGIMAGSPCPAAVMQEVVDKMGMRDITIVFGQTESSPGCTQTHADDPVEVKVNTVGRPLPGVECKIVNPETNEEVGVGVQGEFCARGYNLMRGYYKMEEATRQAIDTDGWLHTGDLATIDENGNYRITGRIKDMIIRGGENIYPKEIEEFLYTHEGVSDVQVIGVPSQQYGEEVMACVILKEGYSLTEDELKDFVRKRMARHKVPRYIRFVEAFPMTASGKIQKYKMRETAIEELALGNVSTIEMV